MHICQEWAGMPDFVLFGGGSGLMGVRPFAGGSTPPHTPPTGCGGAPTALTTGIWMAGCRRVPRQLGWRRIARQGPPTGRPAALPRRLTGGLLSGLLGAGQPPGEDYQRAVPLHKPVEGRGRRGGGGGQNKPPIFLSGTRLKIQGRRKLSLKDVQGCIFLSIFNPNMVEIM